MDMGQTSDHHGYHSGVHQSFAGSGACVVVFTQATILPQSGKRPFHHPALRHHPEARCSSGTLAAVQVPATKVLRPFHQLTSIAPIGPHHPHVRLLPVGAAHHQPCPVPVLSMGGTNHHGQH